MNRSNDFFLMNSKQFQLKFIYLEKKKEKKNRNG